MSRANLIFLTACVSAWILLYHLISLQNRALVVEDRSRGDSLLEIRPAGTALRPLPLKILLIHGLSASKSAMRQLATELARWGSDCYLIDLPGHGDSPESFSVQATDRAVDRVVQSLLSGATSDSVPLVVIGHSFGARAALNVAQRDRRIAGVIALSPAAGPFSRKPTMPVLVVTGEFDFPFVRRGAAFLYEQVTGTRLPRLDAPGQWEDPTTSVRLVVLPWTDHSQTLFKAASLRELKMWLSRISPAIGQAKFSPRAFWVRTQLRVGFCALTLLLWFPVVALLVDLMMPGRKPPKGNVFITVPTSPVRLGWVYAFAGLLATVCLLWINPWERLGLMGGGYLTGLLCITGVLGLAVRRSEPYTPGNGWQALLCSLAAWIILVVGCSPWITEEFVHLNLNPIRFWRFPWISVSVLPFFVFDELICRSLLQGLGKARLVMFHLSTRFILVIALLVGFFVLRNGQFLVVLILPGLLLTSLCCWCLAAWIHRKTGSIAASGLFGALATGWFFSVFFPQV
jgi:pimeloyl-ACP methyl ester carboxylesterase